MKKSDPEIVRRKTKVRKKIEALKFSAAVRKTRGLQLSLKIINSHFFKNASSIGFYVALSDEIDISHAAQKAIDLKKKVFFPRMNREKIEFFEVKNLDQGFKPGKFGVFEPRVSKIKLKRIRPLDLIIIPGRAFDEKGRRLGRGLGCYDRLLAKWKRSVRMGTAFKEQIVGVLPSEPHDIEMDVVLTA